MSLRPSFRARLKEAFEQHADGWRPGGPAQSSPSEREARAAFVADPESAAESTSRRAPGQAAAARPQSTATAPRDEAAAEGSRASRLARLRSPDALREAFVVKEILDRPVGLRPLRGRGIRG